MDSHYKNVNKCKDERGSLALEQVLFIGAIVLMGAGLITFYSNIGDYFANTNFAASPAGLGSSTPGATP